MTALLTFWPLEWMGHLHPLLIHFPIGLIIGALVLDLWPPAGKKERNVAGMVYLGTGGAVLSAIAGYFLQTGGSYEGSLIEQHQWWGIGTALLTLVSSYVYSRKDQLPVWFPRFTLTLTCIAMALTGHFGGSITHGSDYLTSGLPWNQNHYNTTEQQGFLSEIQRADTLSPAQLTKLNLQVRAIFAHNCYQCHSTAKRKGGLALDHREGVFSGGDNGIVIQTGKAEESELVRRLKLPRHEEEAMPPKGKQLRSEELALIEFWIDQGAFWTDEAHKVFHEAELALTKPEIPEGPAGITHPIDLFTDAYFQEQGIRWPALIDDRKFIRRAYMDIVGLLPQPEDVDRFVHSRTPDKRVQLIEQLLADQENYTQNWLTFWNDLLRNDYSGTGFITGGRKQITDWLYRSLQENKPYNSMVAELIDPSTESEGFIKGIQWRGVVNASQRTELQAAQNISQSLLGLNLKCASCHNSFINNLTLDQAYGFANIFAEEPLEINRCDKPTGRMAESAFLYPELGQVKADSLKERLRQLSRIMIRPENGRLYRTVVNRYWDRLLGRGLVAPVDEMDNLPWSQGLLDWLAFHFIENGYDFQQLLKTIMTSRTYQLPPVAYPSPTYLGSEKFVFRGPTLRRLTVEQFADAFSQTISPFYRAVDYNPQQEALAPKWIWHREMEVDRVNIPQPGNRYFRKIFRVEAGKDLLAARLLLTADDAFTCYFNGVKTAEGNNWKSVQSLEIPLDRFRHRNVIAIAGSNEGTIANPAGLLFTLRLEYADGSQQLIYSDRTWKTFADSLAPGSDWTALRFDDSDWPGAHPYGTFQKSYWGMPLEYTFTKRTLAKPFARASLVKQDPFMRALGRPTRENVATQRDIDATLLQALTLTNSQYFSEQLEAGANYWYEQLGNQPTRLLDELYLKLLGRLPSKKERRLLLRQLRRDKTPEQVQDLIWALVNLPEFQFL